MQEVKKNRQQLSKITQTIISPARIRRFIDDLGINKDVEEQLEKIKACINDIKKEGAPSTDNKKDYNDYESPRYKKLEKTYGYFKTFQKLQNLLLHSKDPHKGEEMFRLTRDLADYDYSRVDLKNPDSIGAHMVEMKKLAGMELFIEKDETSKRRVRFNDPAAVAIATAMELGIEELLELGMKRILETQKRTLQPDNCVIGSTSECLWFVFFKNLPHLNAVLERQKRKNLYVLEREKAKQQYLLKSKKDKEKYHLLNKNKKPKERRAKFDFPSFPEHEVKNNYAKKTEVISKDQNGNEETKTMYQWYVIDTMDSPNTINFYFYIQQLCRNIINQNKDNGFSDYDDIKISTNVKKFFSDLIIDFVSKIAPQIRILTDAMNVKTVDHDLIKTILRLMLVDEYHDPSGLVVLKEEHEKLFSLIDKKVRLCQEHQTQTGKVHKNEPEPLSQSSETAPQKTEVFEDEPLGHTEDPTEVVKEPEPLLPEVKPEVKLETKDEVKPEVKLEMKKNEEHQPELKPVRRVIRPKVAVHN